MHVSARLHGFLKYVRSLVQACHGPRAFLRDERANFTVITGFAVLPLIVVMGSAIDLGVAIQTRQRLDSAAQSAAAAAVAQTRALKAGRADISDDEVTSKGRDRAERVFNSQKPATTNGKMKFDLSRNSSRNTYSANVDYDGAVGTVFMRLVGFSELRVRGKGSATWSSKGSIIEDTFQTSLEDLKAAGGVKQYPGLNGWVVNSPVTVGGAPAMQLVTMERFGGASPPGVSVAIELDARGNGGDGNSFISKKFTAETGLHQVRYWYRDSAPSASVVPAWLCSTRVSDVDWMKSRDTSAAKDTNLVSVYLTKDSANAAPASDDGLTDSNRIDSCYSSGQKWIQRVVILDIASAGDYWLTFRGEGRSDSQGGAIANILVCRDPCANDDGSERTANNNYPWEVGQVLFEDNFSTAAHNPIAFSPSANGAFANLPSGWNAWPHNSVNYVANAKRDLAYIDLDTDIGGAKGLFENRAISRAFLLPPGYYSLKYTYWVTDTKSAAPACANATTNLVTVYMDPDRPYNHPEPLDISAGATSLWYDFNRNQQRLIVPRVEKSKGQIIQASSPQAANAIAQNMLDSCGDAIPNRKIPREINFRISKAGYYWLTFAAGGAADGSGGRISQVSLVAKGATFSGSGTPRQVPYVDKADKWTPAIGSWLSMPLYGGPRSYKVLVQ